MYASNSDCWPDESKDQVRLSQKNLLKRAVAQIEPTHLNCMFAEIQEQGYQCIEKCELCEFFPHEVTADHLIDGAYEQTSQEVKQHARMLIDNLNLPKVPFQKIRDCFVRYVDKEFARKFTPEGSAPPVSFSSDEIDTIDKLFPALDRLDPAYANFLVVIINESEGGPYWPDEDE